MKKEPLWLPKQFVLTVHDRLLVEHGGAAGLRDEGLLESALARPPNLFGYGEPSLFACAAAYAFGIAKNHPFIDGNKRTAFVAAAAFLDTNGFELTAPETEATLAMVGLASGTLSEAGFAKWLEKNSKPAP